MRSQTAVWTSIPLTCGSLGDGLHQIAFPRGDRLVHTLSTSRRFPRVVRSAQVYLANDFFGARIMKIKSFLAVRGDELAVDVDVFDALCVGFLFAPVVDSTASQSRSTLLCL
jgi:hypothetical protein